jgi:facilitated trehalose transporter
MQHLDQDTSHIGWLPLATFIVYIVAFSIGYGPIPWLMMGEIFPNKVRGHAAAVATAFNWACSFAVTKAFHDLVDGMGAHGAFWFFGAICLTSTIFVTLFVPETKGCSLEDIEENIMNYKRAKKDVESTQF